MSFTTGGTGGYTVSNITGSNSGSPAVAGARRNPQEGNIDVGSHQRINEPEIASHAISTAGMGGLNELGLPPAAMHAQSAPRRFHLISDFWEDPTNRKRIQQIILMGTYIYDGSWYSLICPREEIGTKLPEWSTMTLPTVSYQKMSRFSRAPTFGISTRKSHTQMEIYGLALEFDGETSDEPEARQELVLKLAHMVSALNLCAMEVVIKKMMNAPSYYEDIRQRTWLFDHRNNLVDSAVAELENIGILHKDPHAFWKLLNDEKAVFEANEYGNRLSYTDVLVPPGFKSWLAYLPIMTDPAKRGDMAAVESHIHDGAASIGTELPNGIFFHETEILKVWTANPIRMAHQLVTWGRFFPVIYSTKDSPSQWSNKMCTIQGLDGDLDDWCDIDPHDLNKFSMRWADDGSLHSAHQELLTDIQRVIRDNGFSVYHGQVDMYASSNNKDLSSVEIASPNDNRLNSEAFSLTQFFGQQDFSYLDPETVNHAAEVAVLRFLASNPREAEERIDRLISHLESFSVSHATPDVLAWIYACAISSRIGDSSEEFNSNRIFEKVTGLPVASLPGRAKSGHVLIEKSSFGVAKTNILDSTKSYYVCYSDTAHIELIEVTTTKTVADIEAAFGLIVLKYPQEPIGYCTFAAADYLSFLLKTGDINTKFASPSLTQKVREISEGLSAFANLHKFLQDVSMSKGTPLTREDACTFWMRREKNPDWNSRCATFHNLFNLVHYPLLVPRGLNLLKDPAEESTLKKIFAIHSADKDFGKMFYPAEKVSTERTFKNLSLLVILPFIPKNKLAKKDDEYTKADNTKDKLSDDAALALNFNYAKSLLGSDANLVLFENIITENGKVALADILKKITEKLPKEEALKIPDALFKVVEQNFPDTNEDRTKFLAKFIHLYYNDQLGDDEKRNPSYVIHSQKMFFDDMDNYGGDNDALYGLKPQATGQNFSLSEPLATDLLNLEDMWLITGLSIDATAFRSMNGINLIRSPVKPSFPTNATMPLSTFDPLGEKETDNTGKMIPEIDQNIITSQGLVGQARSHYGGSGANEGNELDRALASHGKLSMGEMAILSNHTMAMRGEEIRNSLRARHAWSDKPNFGLGPLQVTESQIAYPEAFRLDPEHSPFLRMVITHNQLGEVEQHRTTFDKNVAARLRANKNLSRHLLRAMNNFLVTLPIHRDQIHSLLDKEIPPMTMWIVWQLGIQCAMWGMVFFRRFQTGMLYQGLASNTLQNDPESRMWRIRSTFACTAALINQIYYDFVKAVMYANRGYLGGMSLARSSYYTSLEEFQPEQPLRKQTIVTAIPPTMRKCDLPRILDITGRHHGDDHFFSIAGANELQSSVQTYPSGIYTSFILQAGSWNRGSAYDRLDMDSLANGHSFPTFAAKANYRLYNPIQGVYMSGPAGCTPMPALEYPGQMRVLKGLDRVFRTANVAPN